MAAAEPLGDALALKIQELRQQGAPDGRLLRIDNREEAARAPYQFDTVKARLHRTGCRAIPEGSRTALYGVWRLPAQAETYACPTCRPHADDEAPVAARDGITDYLYGVLSVLDQFGSVIRERGREFRESEQGRQLKAGLDGVYRNLEEREREALQSVLSSLDGLLTTIDDVNRNLEGRNGDGRNGDGRHF